MNESVDLSGNKFLDGFSPAGRAELEARALITDYPDGASIFREGEAADGVCLVMAGEVEIFKEAERRERVLGRFRAGEYLGEVAVLDGYGRSTSARATGEVTLAVIPRAPLLAALEREPLALTLRIFQQVLGHLRRTNELFVHEVLQKQKLALVGEMASSLMHDLRNPIGGIGLYADLLEMVQPGDETKRCCDGIRQQCDRVVAMASELLEFSRGEAKLHAARTNALEFLQKFGEMNKAYFEKTGTDFEFQARPDEVDLDEMRLSRLLQNLVNNAVDALDGKPNARVIVRAWVDDGLFHLQVQDNGPGIPEAVQPRIFEPFVTHGKKNGTGLGMSIVQNVATAHGGTVDFVTGPDGTAFNVSFPQFRRATQPLPVLKPR